MVGPVSLLAQSGPPAMPPPVVTYTEVTPTTAAVSYDLVGLVAASRIVEVRARVKGFIAQRLFEEGANVKEGDLLFKIDRRTFEADVQVFQARVEQAQSREQLARREEDRLKSLVARSLVSQSDYDRANEELMGARAALRLAQAELNKSKLELSFTDIRSPLTGVVGKTEQEEGSYVDEANNSLLTSVQRLDPIHVICGVSEREFLLYQDDLRSGRLVLPPGEKMHLRVQLASGKAYEGPGQVDFEDTGFNVQTGIRQLRGLFPNPDLELRPGQFVKVRVEGYLRPGAIVVPQKSVSLSPLGSAVFVIGEGNKLEPRPVTLGKMSGDRWVIESGLQAGDRVMVDGIMKTQGPGTVVQPVKEGSPEAEAASKPGLPPGMGGPGAAAPGADGGAGK
jgi:membrane fusion protein (multidrug efflux system)